MKIFYRLNGAERKPLVKAIEDITGEKAKYKGVPSCAYGIGCYSIEKDGTLAADDSVSMEQFDELAMELAENGFEGEKDYMNEKTEEDEDEGNNTIDSLTVSLPMDGFDERSLSNLRNFLTAKGGLIKKVMGIEDMPVEVTDERVFFPWFHRTLTYDEVQAYTLFIVNLCALAKKTGRISASEKQVENQKYAWRCTLLRLGFIGDGSKLYRKILMRNFSGESGAFKCGHKHTTSDNEEAATNEDAE